LADVLAQDAQTIVMAQIEEPEGVEEIDAIVGAEGVDAVFIGPADLSVAFGKSDTNSEELAEAMTRVGAAAKVAGKGFVTWVPNGAKAAEWDRFGFTSYVVGSEHSWMLQGAKAVVFEVKG